MPSNSLNFEVDVSTRRLFVIPQPMGSIDANSLSEATNESTALQFTKALGKAQNLYDNGKHEQAESFLLELTSNKTCPQEKLAMGLNLLARIYADRGELEQAEAELDLAAQAAKDAPVILSKVLRDRGFLKHKRGDLGKAAIDLFNAYNTWPALEITKGEALVERSYIYFRQDMLHNAEGSLELAQEFYSKMNRETRCKFLQIRLVIGLIDKRLAQVLADWQELRKLLPDPEATLNILQEWARNDVAANEQVVLDVLLKEHPSISPPNYRQLVASFSNAEWQELCRAREKYSSERTSTSSKGEQPGAIAEPDSFDTGVEFVLPPQTQPSRKKATLNESVVEKKEMSSGDEPVQSEDATSLEDVVKHAFNNGIDQLTLPELQQVQLHIALEIKRKLSTKRKSNNEQVINQKPLANYLKKLSDSDSEVSLQRLAQLYANVNAMILTEGELTTAIQSSDWKLTKEVASLGEDAMRQIEVKERFNRACQVIDDFNPGEEVTPNRLTKFFAKKHKAAKTHLKRTEGEVLPDDKKRELVELVDAFRALGGAVKLDGVPCTMELNKTSSMKQSRFSVRSADAAQDKLWANIKVPQLKFYKK